MPVERKSGVVTACIHNCLGKGSILERNCASREGGVAWPCLKAPTLLSGQSASFFDKEVTRYPPPPRPSVFRRGVLKNVCMGASYRVVRIPLKCMPLTTFSRDFLCDDAKKLDCSKRSAPLIRLFIRKSNQFLFQGDSPLKTTKISYIR